MPGSRAPLFAVLAALALAAGAGTCNLARHTPPGSVHRLSLESLGIELFLGLGAVALATLGRRPATRRLGLGRGVLGRREAFLLVLGTLALSHALDAVLTLLGLREHSALQQFDQQLAGQRGGALALALLCVGVAPGIGEEIFCRGLVQRGVAARLGAPAGVMAGALVFGVLHVEPLHALFATALGLYLGVAGWWSGGTRLPIACHVFNNLLAVLAAAAPIGMPLPPGPSAVGGLALAAAALFVVSRGRASPPAQDGGHGEQVT